jgi:hypothetical protein
MTARGAAVMSTVVRGVAITTPENETLVKLGALSSTIVSVECFTRMTRLSLAV